MIKNRQFDPTKVPQFIVRCKDKQEGKILRAVLKEVGYDTTCPADGNSLGNAWVGQKNHEKCNDILWGYDNETMAELCDKHPSASIFNLDTELGDFLDFIKESQKVIKIEGMLDGGRVRFIAWENRVEFSSSVSFLNNKDLELIQEAKAKLD